MSKKIPLSFNTKISYPLWKCSLFYRFPQVIDTFWTFCTYIMGSFKQINRNTYSSPLALRALPLRKWESCDKLLHSLVRGRRETVAPFATPMRNKHCLRRREIYLPRGVPKGRLRRRGAVNSIAIMFLFKTEELLVIEKPCSSFQLSVFTFRAQ